MPLDGETTLVTYYRGDDPVGTIMLRREAKLNAINPAMMRDLGVALNRFHSDSGAKVAVLAGAGRAFCAGVDTGEVPRDERPIDPAADLKRLPELLLVRNRFKPIVAAVHGHVVGAGLRLALHSDFVICAESTKFRVPEVGYDLDGGPYWALLGLRAGDAFAMDVVGTGRTWTAQEAVDRGIFTASASDDAVFETARLLAQQLSLQPSHALTALVESRRTALRATELTAWATRGRELGWSERSRNE